MEKLGNHKAALAPAFGRLSFSLSSFSLSLHCFSPALGVLRKTIFMGTHILIKLERIYVKQIIEYLITVGEKQ